MTFSNSNWCSRWFHFFFITRKIPSSTSSHPFVPENPRNSIAIFSTLSWVFPICISKFWGIFFLFAHKGNSFSPLKTGRCSIQWLLSFPLCKTDSLGTHSVTLASSWTSQKYPPNQSKPWSWSSCKIRIWCSRISLCSTPDKRICFWYRRRLKRWLFRVIFCTWPGRSCYFWGPTSRLTRVQRIWSFSLELFHRRTSYWSNEQRKSSRRSWKGTPQGKRWG